MLAIVAFLFAWTYVQRVGVELGLDFTHFDWGAGAFREADVSIVRIGAALTYKHGLARGSVLFAVLTALPRGHRSKVARGLLVAEVARTATLVTTLFFCRGSFWTALRIIGVRSGAAPRDASEESTRAATLAVADVADVADVAQGAMVTGTVGAPSALPDLVVPRAAPRQLATLVSPVGPGKPERPVAAPKELDWDDHPDDLPRGRDTPTEMYQKAFELSAPPGETPISVAPPPIAVAKPGVEATPRGPIPSRPTVRMSVEVRAPDPFPGEPTTPSVRRKLPDNAAYLLHGEEPGSVSSPNLTPPPGALQRPASRPLPAAPRPEWQRSLDALLDDVGSYVERVGASIAEAFRAAPPRQQLALVVIGAGVVAVFLILIVYLNLGRHAAVP